MQLTGYTRIVIIHRSKAGTTAHILNPKGGWSTIVNGAFMTAETKTRDVEEDIMDAQQTNLETKSIEIVMQHHGRPRFDWMDAFRPDGFGGDNDSEECNEVADFLGSLGFEVNRIDDGRNVYIASDPTYGSDPYGGLINRESVHNALNHRFGTTSNRHLNA